MGVSGPHNGKYMFHVAEVAFNGEFLDGSAAYRQDVHAESPKNIWRYGVRSSMLIISGARVINAQNSRYLRQKVFLAYGQDAQTPP